MNTTRTDCPHCGHSVQTGVWCSRCGSALAFATIASRTNTLGAICAWDVTTPSGEVVPFQSYSHAKAFVANGCPA